jgi:hypothetical protein
VGRQYPPLLLGRDHKNRVYVHDWCADYLVDWLAVLDAGNSQPQIAVVEVHAQHDFLAASATREFMHLGCIVTHADPDGVRFSADSTLQRIPDDHPKPAKWIEDR